jgi:hypothetical protein
MARNEATARPHRTLFLSARAGGQGVIVANPRIHAGHHLWPYEAVKSPALCVTLSFLSCHTSG